MYTPEDVQQLDTDSARRVFDALAIAHYNTERWKAQFARDVGMEPTSLTKWFAGKGRPQAWAFQLIQAWIDRDRAHNALRNIRSGLKFAENLD